MKISQLALESVGHTITGDSGDVNSMTQSLPRRALITCTHVITDLEVAGAEIMLYKLVTYMDRARFQNSVVSLTTLGPVGERLRAREIPVVALGMRRGHLVDLRAVWRLTRFLQETRTDIVQTWMYHADLTGLVAGRLAAVPYVVWNIRRAAPEFQNRRLTRWIVSLLNAPLSYLPTAIIVNSEAGRRAHVQLGYRPGKLTVIPNGFDLERFRPRPELRGRLRTALKLPGEAFVIGMVANWRSIKGHGVFLRAATRFAAAYPSAYFVLVGAMLNGYPAHTVDALLQGSLGQQVRLLGLRDDVPELLQTFDVFSSCSFGEGFPNAVGEAMACGVPCVVTDVGDSATIVGDTGVVVPPGDPTAVADAWETLFAMGPEERRRLGEAARLRIARHYEIRDVARLFEQLYANLVDSKFSPAP